MTKQYPSEAFLSTETRSGYEVPAKMKKLWACQLDLLQELLMVCEKYGLSIFAYGGTLIGAIRHQGFIPWDDDIDMAMLREDYDKLLSVAADEFKHPYFFQTIYSDGHYTHRHAQLRNSETAFYKKLPLRGKFNQGIFVDIMVIDYVPSSPRAFIKHIRRLKNAKFKLKMKTRICNLLPEKCYRYCRQHIPALSDVEAFRRYEDLLRSVKAEDTYLCCKLCLNMTSPVKRISNFREVKWVDFEYIKMPIPIGYDEILSVRFGDYMKPVMAPSTHGRMNFDTERSYLELSGK